MDSFAGSFESSRNCAIHALTILSKCFLLYRHIAIPWFNPSFHKISKEFLRAGINPICAREIKGRGKSMIARSAAFRQLSETAQRRITAQCCGLWFHASFRICIFIWRRGVIWSAMVRPAVDSISRKRRSRFETDRRQFTHYIYGGVVQAASHDPGEGEARAHIREKLVRGQPPPRMGQVGQTMMGHDGCASRCPRNPCR